MGNEFSDSRSSVWDWRKQTRLSRFSNANPAGTKITEMKFINEDDQAFLLSGSSDGVIRVYKNYEVDGRVVLVTAWRALSDLVNSNFNSGLVFEWQQGQGRALVAGDVKIIRVWSAATELCTTVCINVLTTVNSQVLKCI